jgi:hypothetical protein
LPHEAIVVHHCEAIAREDATTATERSHCELFAQRRDAYVGEPAW